MREGGREGLYFAVQGLRMEGGWGGGSLCLKAGGREKWAPFAL